MTFANLLCTATTWIAVFIVTAVVMVRLTELGLRRLFWRAVTLPVLAVLFLIEMVFFFWPRLSDWDWREYFFRKVEEAWS